ncbi:MAG: enoyl-CoA hydratase-related protein [Actinomycetota bacterium]
MSLSYSVRDGVAVIVLDRPTVLNAFDDDLGRRALEAVERAAADDEVRCIAITGAGRAFSSGEDLAALSEGYERGEAPDLGRILRTRYNPLIRALVGAPKPVVAAVNGVAAGAGASVALACDFRVASEHAKLTFGFARVGLVPDSGALWFLARMVGSARAWNLAVSARVVSADEGRALGLFDQVLAADEFEGGWRTLARELAVGPTRAFALTKKLLAEAPEHSLDLQLDAEVTAQAEAGASEDHLEGVQAFLAKRPPRFTGR